MPDPSKPNQGESPRQEPSEPLNFTSGVDRSTIPGAEAQQTRLSSALSDEQFEVLMSTMKKEVEKAVWYAVREALQPAPNGSACVHPEDAANASGLPSSGALVGKGKATLG